MNFWSSIIFAHAMALCVATGPCWALSTGSDSIWLEVEAPPPPAFDSTKLIPFDVSPNSSLVYGIDPTAIQISRSDGVVRYVIVATSNSGAKNVLYEGIRCSTGEVKTYARYNSNGQWSKVAAPEWRSMFDLPSKHALRFAQSAACDSAATASTAAEVARRLKYPNSGLGN